MPNSAPGLPGQVSHAGTTRFTSPSLTHAARASRSALLALMRIDGAHGVVEVGLCALFAATEAATAMATEAQLAADAVMSLSTLGYRRYEWKCNSLNDPVSAARRGGLGFQLRRALSPGRWLSKRPQPRHRLVFRDRRRSGRSMDSAMRRKWLAAGNFDRRRPAAPHAGELSQTNELTPFFAPLHRLEARVALADNVQPPFAFHQLAIRVALFSATQ